MTQTAFDMLDDKYGSPDPGQLEVVDDPVDPGSDKRVYPAAEAEPMVDWKQSPAICKLSAFLKEYSDIGVTIRQDDRDPVLCFDPGLGSRDQDPERFDLCVHAADLYDRAKSDLQDLIQNGYLALEKYTDIWR